MIEGTEKMGAIDLAKRHHNAGRFPEAEGIYLEVLRGEPDHPVALHLLGVIAYQAGDYDHAVELITKSLAIKPDDAMAHYNLGNALRELGRLDEAVAKFLEAIAVKPDLAEAHNNLGNTLEELGRLDDAVSSYQMAIAIKSDYAEAHFNLGNTFQELGQFDTAVASYEKAISFKPDFAEAHNNLGSAIFSIERQRDLEMGPSSGYTEAYAHLDTTAKELGALGYAVASFQKALDINPDSAEAHNNLGNVLKERRWLDDAAECYKKAIAIKPDLAEAHNNLGNVFHDLGRLEEAEVSYRRGLEMKPDDIDTLIELGKVLRDIGFGHRRGPDDVLPELNFAAAAARENQDDPKSKQALWDEVLGYADRVLAQEPGNTSALGLKTTAFVGSGRDEEGLFLSDFERFMQIETVSVPPGYPDLKTFNEALVQRLDSDPDLIEQPHEQSMSGGKRIYNLQRDGENSPIHHLLKIYDDALVRYLDTHPIDPEHPFLAQRPKKWIKDVFGNIWKGQGHVRSHIHPDSWITACYYAKLPDVMATENERHQAWIEFGRPPDYLANKPDPAFPVYQPVEGMLVMWPSYLYHQTIPFQSTGIRSSLPCDFVPVS